MRKYLCGVPKGECTGSSTEANQGLGKYVMAHSTNEQAFKCYKNYLLRSGYKQVGARDFANPTDGRVLILNRKSKFGAPMRKGKSVKGQPSKRIVPKAFKRSKGGHII